MMIALLAFLYGILAGTCLISMIGDLVIVRGLKDSFQLVTWKEKNYRLEPLDKP